MMHDPRVKAWMDEAAAEKVIVVAAREQVHLVKGRGGFIAQCPRCKGADDGLCVDPEANSFYCSEAGIGGGSIELIEHLRDVPRGDACAILTGKPPPPYRSQFGAFTWAGTFAESEPYRWLVKSVIPEGESVLVYGAPQTGKSFSIQHMAMCIARGVPYHGFRTRKAGVVYCAFEGGKGFRKRQKAYALHHGLTANDDVPMVVLTRRADLFSSDADMELLATEIRHWQAQFDADGVGLGLIVMDTWSAATPGADENQGRDVSLVKDRIMWLIHQFGCALIVVHHKPKAGTGPRGHGSLTGDFETTIDVDWDGDGRHDLRDADDRPVRRAKLIKQREGEAGISWRFVLPSVEIGRDEDGDPITSCVVTDPVGLGAAASPPERAQDGRTADGRVVLPPNAEMALRALQTALDRCGRAPADHVTRHGSASCVVLRDWQEELEKLKAESDEEPDKLRERVKKFRERATDKLISMSIIGKEGEWVWRTGRKVANIDRPVRKPEPLTMPDDLDGADFL